MSYVVAFTGHRPDKLGKYGAYNPVRDKLKLDLRDRLIRIRAEHPDLTCISGMALGFDQWAAEVCVELGVPFTAAVPFVGQESRWPRESQDHYNALLAKAALVQVVCGGTYAPDKMQRRNEWMMDRCDYYLAAWDGSAGGTKNCLDYARKIGRLGENLLLTK